MHDFWDFDDGNGNYDVETYADHERWKHESWMEQRSIDREGLTKEEFDEKYNSTPF